MSRNKEEIKNKIIYRSSYRGTKEMDILMTNFVKNIIDNLSHDQLIHLDEFVNYDDEVLKDELEILLDEDILGPLENNCKDGCCGSLHPPPHTLTPC